MASFKEANYEMSQSSSVPSVQELVKKPLTSIPLPYIRPQHPLNIISQNRKENIPLLPTIDMHKLIHGEDATQLDELHKLHSACTDWGFFQLVKHGIEPKVLEKVKDEIEGFFNLPLEEKMKYKIRAGDVEFEGYGSVVTSKDEKLDWGDRFYMTTNPLHTRKPYLFPELPSSLKNILDSYIQELQSIAKTLVGLLEKALKIENREIEELVEDGKQSMRMTYYPACSEPEKVMGLTAHSDSTIITILNQLNGVNGLQIKKHGLWVPVNVISQALVVNVGDVLEIVSNGAYKSVEHRAMVNSEKERISVAMFFNPKLESVIGPSISLTNPNNPPLYKNIAMDKYLKDFFSRKLDGKSYLEHMKINNQN